MKDALNDLKNRERVRETEDAENDREANKTVV